MLGNHGGQGKFMIQGSTDPQNPPFLCARPAEFRRVARRRLFLYPQHDGPAPDRPGRCGPALERE